LAFKVKSSKTALESIGGRKNQKFGKSQPISANQKSPVQFLPLAQVTQTQKTRSPAGVFF
jgi:hypothetical protein